VERDAGPRLILPREVDTWNMSDGTIEVFHAEEEAHPCASGIHARIQANAVRLV
jgi:hypothetical protein